MKSVATQSHRGSSGSRLAAWMQRNQAFSWAVFGAVLVAVPVLLLWPAAHQPISLTQQDIDDAVRHTMETQPLPSRTARAAELVRESVVRVRGYISKDPDDEKSGADGAKPKDQAQANGPGQKPAEKPQAGAGKPGPGEPDLPEEITGDNARPGERLFGIGSGVVILENGTILTNLHVVAGAERLSVTFHDGTESEAVVVGLHPKNDLAVIRARKIPDDLPAAVMGSAGRLRPGDEVVAVGFPFGIGPSVSAGVVSGLNRSLRSPKGENMLSGLIQFDAAANSGNSGGPLVNMEGELVGIVTAILNPTRARTFIGIGFAVTMESAGMAVGIPPF